MDPFSLTVGALSLIGAATATAKMLKKLAALRRAPEELMQLINEVLFDSRFLNLIRLIEVGCRLSAHNHED